MSFTFCPRCNSRTLENLKTHSYCIDCNYCPDLSEQAEEKAIPDWALEALRNGGANPTAEELLAEEPLIRGVA